MKMHISFSSKEIEALYKITNKFSLNDKIEVGTHKSKAMVEVTSVDDAGNVTSESEIKEDFVIDVFHTVEEFSDIILGLVQSCKGLTSIVKERFKKWETPTWEHAINHEIGEGKKFAWAWSVNGNSHVSSYSNIPTKRAVVGILGELGNNVHFGIVDPDGVLHLYEGADALKCTFLSKTIIE